MAYQISEWLSDHSEIITDFDNTGLLCQYHRPAVICSGMCDSQMLLAKKMIRLTELNGNHDPTMHGFIQVIGTVGGHYYQPIMPEEKKV